GGVARGIVWINTQFFATCGSAREAAVLREKIGLTMDMRSVAARFLVACVTLLILPWSASAQGVLSVSPTSIVQQAGVGVPLPSQTVNISSSGNGALKWSISTPTASWLSVSPTSGVQPGNVTVSFASTLAAGTYSASFRVSTNQSAVTVNVQVTINP